MGAAFRKMQRKGFRYVHAPNPQHLATLSLRRKPPHKCRPTSRPPHHSKWTTHLRYAVVPPSSNASISAEDICPTWTILTGGSNLSKYCLLGRCQLPVSVSNLADGVPELIVLLLAHGEAPELWTCAEERPTWAAQSRQYGEGIRIPMTVYFMGDEPFVK